MIHDDLKAEREIAALRLKTVDKNGTGGDKWQGLAQTLTGLAASKMEVGQMTRADCLLGRFLEAMAASRPADLRSQLIRLAAFAETWAGKIDTEAPPAKGRHRSKPGYKDAQ